MEHANSLQKTGVGIKLQTCTATTHNETWLVITGAASRTMIYCCLNTLSHLASKVVVMSVEKFAAYKFHLVERW